MCDNSFLAVPNWTEDFDINWKCSKLLLGKGNCYLLKSQMGRSISSEHNAHEKKSDHLKLRCDDGNRQRPGFDDRAGGRLENGWHPGPVGTGGNGWGDGLRSHHLGKEGGCWCYSREKERKVKFWLRKGWIMPKLDPFYPQTTTFLRICAARWQIHFHIMRTCKLQCEEHFIVWLHWFVLSGRSKKSMEAW